MPARWRVILMLDFDAVTKRFGPVTALDGCSFAARQGRLTRRDRIQSGDHSGGEPVDPATPGRPVSGSQEPGS
jgi:hypothetical protein